MKATEETTALAIVLVLYSEVLLYLTFGLEYIQSILGRADMYNSR